MAHANRLQHEANQLVRDKEYIFMEGANKVTQQIEAHLTAFGERCDIGKTHFEAAMLLREHEQLESAALRTYATASQLLKTAEQLVKLGNVDRDKVRETTKKLDTLWQGLTLKLNTHKEALSYSVTFHQKLEQVTGWLTNWHYAIEQQQSKLASPELMLQVHRQGEVLTELYTGLQLDSRHLIKLLISNKQYGDAAQYVSSQLNLITSQYNDSCSLWNVYKSAHATSNKIRKLEVQCSKIRGFLDSLEKEFITAFYDITTSLEVIKSRIKKLSELDDRLDPILADIDSMKYAASELLAEGNENAINLVSDINNHWTIFKLKKQQCEQYLLFTTHLYTQIRDVESNIRTLRQLIKQHKTQGSTETYNEFQSLKSSVLQQSSEICRQGRTMLELISLMCDTCKSGALDKPGKHIQTVIEKFKGADSVVRDLRLHKVEKKREGIENWINVIGEVFLQEHSDVGGSVEEADKYSTEFTAFLDEVSGVQDKVESLADPTLVKTWSEFSSRLTNKHEQILLAKAFFLHVDEYHNRFKLSQDSLTIDQLPDDVVGTDTMLIQCRTEPQDLQNLYNKVAEVFSAIVLLLANQSQSVLKSRVIHMQEIMNKLKNLHDDIQCSWKDREQKLNKGLELRKFEQGIKNLYLWISNDGESFIRSHSLFPTLSANLALIDEEFRDFQQQIAVEEGRMRELEKSCKSLKDCIIFDNGAIDTRMTAARNSWRVFNEKCGLRRKLLVLMREEIVPPLEKYRERLRYWRLELQKAAPDVTTVHVNLLKHLNSQIQEERRRVQHTIKDKVYTPGHTEDAYIDKFVRNIHEDIEGMLKESREIDTLLLSRTTSINSLSSVTSSGSVSSDSKMSITSDEGCNKSRQPQAKLPNGAVPAGKPPIHYGRHQGPDSHHSSNGNRKHAFHRPDSINSDSGIIGSSGSDTSQSRWSWPEDGKASSKLPTVPDNPSSKLPTVPDNPSPDQPAAGAESSSKKLKLVVEELVKSEHDYVAGLSFVVRKYRPALEKHPLWRINEPLLGNIEEIYKFHRELFLPDLLQCAGDPASVAAVFLKYKGKYDMHVEYCRNKTHSGEVYSEHEQELEAIQKQLNQSLSLSAYLIKPVQRITKYQLLLAEMRKFGKCCNLGNIEKIEAACAVMVEVPRKANNLMHLEMFIDPPEDVLIHQDAMSVNSGSAWIQGQGKTRQVFLFKHCLTLAKHELEGKKLQYYSRKNVIELVNATLSTSGEETCRFSLASSSTKYWFVTATQSQNNEWVKLIRDAIDYCTKGKSEDRVSMGSNNSNEEKKGINKIRSSLRFKRRKSLTKLNTKEEEMIRETSSDQNDWAQPYITNNRLTTDHIIKDKEEDNYNRCISKLSNISMSIDHINLIPSEHPVSSPDAPLKQAHLQRAPPLIQTGYKFTDILFYGHFSMFAMCEHRRTGLKFTAQITPVVDRQFYRSVQREVDILKVLNYKRVSRLHEIILDYDSCVVLILSYQHQLHLLDFLLLKDSHKEHETTDIIKSVLEGVFYLHSRNIAHLDIKPENLIWDKTSIKLINYELAHYVDEENVFLEPSMLDDEFASPELLMGRVSTTAADIWSVGVLSYLLLYSDSPFFIQGKVIPPEMRAFHNSKGNSVFSDNTLIFLTSLLQNDPRRRPNAQGCLNSTWVKSSNYRNTGIYLDKNRLRKFCLRRRHEANSRHFDVPESILEELGLGNDML